MDVQFCSIEKITSQTSCLTVSDDESYSHGFQPGSMRQMLSKLEAAEMRVETCDLPVSKSAKSGDKE